jgi:hypothetical protein
MTGNKAFTAENAATRNALVIFFAAHSDKISQEISVEQLSQHQTDNNPDLLPSSLMWFVQP